MSCESVQKGTKCPAMCYRAHGAAPGKADFVPGGRNLKTGGHNHFTKVLGRHSAKAGPGSLHKALGHFLGQGRSHSRLCFPGSAAAQEEPHKLNAKALPFPP